jgi:hypothetical protein
LVVWACLRGIVILGAELGIEDGAPDGTALGLELGVDEGTTPGTALEAEVGASLGWTLGAELGAEDSRLTGPFYSCSLSSPGVTAPPHNII